MDSRHESLKEGFLNHVITTINTYMLDNIDTLVKDKNLQSDMTDICKGIYQYLDIAVDTENIISIHNLLSKDVVIFPCIPDPEGNKILNDNGFEELVHAIKNTLVKDNSDSLLKKRLLGVIDEFEL